MSWDLSVRLDSVDMYSDLDSLIGAEVCFTGSTKY